LVVLLPVTPPWSRLGSAAAVAAAVNRRPTRRSRYLPTPTQASIYVELMNCGVFNLFKHTPISRYETKRFTCWS